MTYGNCDTSAFIGTYMTYGSVEQVYLFEPIKRMVTWYKCICGTVWD
jgi:hypothetical protein